MALKMVGPKLVHKTDAGAVALGIEDPEALMRAATDMRAAVARYSEQVVTDLFLVEPMAQKPLAELVVGIRCDAQFGLAMTLGSGGILVELLGDTVTLLLQSTRAEIAAALDGLKVARLPDGYRGGPAADKAAVVTALEGWARYALAHRESLVEIETSPLFAYENGGLAVDVLMQVGAD